MNLSADEVSNTHEMFINTEITQEESARYQLKLQPVLPAIHEKSDSHVWIDRLNNRVCELFAKEQQKQQYQKFLHYNRPAITIGGNVAGFCKPIFNGAKWFNHAVEDDLRLTVGPSVKHLIFIYKY
uniref:Transcriptional regulator n=1 Tax=Globodera pallida TaxID=36090 RepID=A0A183C3R3_GLOPA